MCQCTPSIRTPYCGRGDCTPPRPDGTRSESQAAVGDALEAKLQGMLRPPTPAERHEALLDELRAVLNRYSVENASDTPDFLLAEYVSSCLDAYATAVKARDRWFGFSPWPQRVTAQQIDTGITDGVQQ